MLASPTGPSRADGVSCDDLFILCYFFFGTGIALGIASTINTPHERDEQKRDEQKTDELGTHTEESWRATEGERRWVSKSFVQMPTPRFVDFLCIEHL